MRLFHRLGRRYLSLNFRPFGVLYGLLSKVRFIGRVTRQGRTFRIPVRNAVGLQNLLSGYEPWLSEVLRILELGPAATMIDVGANTGQSIMSALAVMPDLRIIAVEPNPHCVNYLKTLVQENALGRVQVAGVALGHEAGFMSLRTRYRDDLLGTTTVGFRVLTNYSHEEEVPATTGDALCEELGVEALDLIKIDVEGGESSVLEGFRHTLRQLRPVVICEVLPVESEVADVTRLRMRAAKSLLKLLQDVEYEAFSLRTHHRVISVDDFSNDLGNRDYIFVPSEKRTLASRLFRQLDRSGE